MKLWAILFLAVVLVTLTKKHGRGKQEKKLWFICIFYKDIVETV